MPYQTTWVPPELFLTHAGVNVFHTYKDDDVDQGAERYWFTTSVRDDEEEDCTFDVRELDSACLLGQHPPFLQGENNTPENREAWGHWYKVEEPDTIRAIIVASLDAGMITLPESVADNAHGVDLGDRDD